MPDDARPVPGPPASPRPSAVPTPFAVPGPPAVCARVPADVEGDGVPDVVAELRRASAALDAPDDGDFDAAAHAERFEAVHDALVAVLADVDRG